MRAAATIKQIQSHTTPKVTESTTDHIRTDFQTRITNIQVEIHLTVNKQATNKVIEDMTIKGTNNGKTIHQATTITKEAIKTQIQIILIT